MIGGNFSDFNKIDNHNRIHQYSLAVEKYCVTQGGYFGLATIVALIMGIADGKLLFCHVISEQSKYKTISMRE